LEPLECYTWYRGPLTIDEGVPEPFVSHIPLCDADAADVGNLAVAARFDSPPSPPSARGQPLWG
jgi:hypothetical protein